MNPKYNSVKVNAAVSGWVLQQKGKPDEIFVRWESLVKRLEELLMSRR